MPAWRSRCLACASPSAAQVPLDLSAEVAKTASVIDLTSISGEVDGVPITGSAHFDLGGEQPRFNLAAKTDFASLPALLGSLVAWQRTPSTETLLGSLNQSASDVWPARGFALEALGSADGEIRIEANTLALGAPFKVEDATLIANVSAQGLAVTDLQGRLFGGSLTASGTLVPKGTGAELKAHAELATGRMDQLSQALAGRVLAKGPFTFVMDVSGEGLSPPGLVAGLSGDGALFLDPAPCRPVARAVETRRGRSQPVEKLKLDKDQIAARMTTLKDTLTKGTYVYSATALPFAIKNGTLKLDPAALAGKGAETAINGYVELASLRLDSEWAMRLKDSRDADMPPVNLVFAGPLSDAGAIAPQIDTAPMGEGFLTVRRMEGDVERLETLDVSGRGQPEAEAEADSAEAEFSDGSDEPVAQVTTEALAAKKQAVEKRAADRAAEVKRIAAEKAAAEKRAAEQAAAEKRAAEKAAADKLAAEKEAAEKAAAEKRAAEKAAAEQAAAEKRAAEKAAAEKRAAEKAAAAKAAAEKRAAEKEAAEKAWAEKRAAEKAAAEKRAAEKAAAAKAAAEKRAAEKGAAEKALAEKRAAEKAAAEQRAAEKAAAEKAAAEKRAAEKEAAEKAAAEKRAAEKAEAQQRAAEKRAAEKAESEQRAAEKAAAAESRS